MERPSNDGALVAPNVRRTWLIAGGIATVVMVVIGTMQVIGIIAREDRTVRQTFSAGGLRTVEVATDDGDIRVIGDEETHVRVVIHLRESWRKVERTARVDAGRLVLTASCPVFGSVYCEAAYEVHVPPGMRVVASSDNGDASVRDVTGGARLVSNNGDLSAVDLGGVVTFETDNGAIDARGLSTLRATASSNNGDVTLRFSTPPGSAKATSDNGDVEVIVPRGDEMYALDATTDNGDSSTPVRTDPLSKRRVVARSDNGDVVVRYP